MQPISVVEKVKVPLVEFDAMNGLDMLISRITVHSVRKTMEKHLSLVC